MKISKKIRVLKFLLLLSSSSYLLVGGGFLWKVFISSKVYRRYIAGFLDKIENVTAAISVILILAVLPLQYPQMPSIIQVLILINAPIAFATIVILLAENKFGAWKSIFEVYTEEFSAQTIIIKNKLTKKNRKPIIIALIGNWAAIPVAIYDVGSAMYWVLGDMLLVTVALIILGLKYIASMIEATREVIEELRELKERREA